MRILSFHIKTALSNMFRNIGINLLTIFSISVGLFLIAITTLTLNTLNRAVGEWTEGFGLVVYIMDSLDAESIIDLKARIENEPEVKEARFISKETAMSRLKKVLGEATLEGLDENPLPNSLEISLKQGNIQPDNVRRFAIRLKKIDGVEDVQFGEKWVGLLATAARRFTLFGSALGISLAVGIVFILSNTIKVLFYRRSNEIKILKLLGATSWFIRIPFLVEGIFFGSAAGVLASGASYGAAYWLGSGQALNVSLVWPTYAVILFGGVLGVVGSLLAVGRIRL